MSNRFFLGAYWAARNESIDQCADRLLRFFSRLGECASPVLSTWYELGRSRKQALQKRAEIVNRDYLLRLLERGRHRQDIGRAIIEELGCHIRLWNGAADGNDAGLGVTCGLYWRSPSPNVDLGNCVTLNLPADLGELREPERMARVLTAVANAWEPDWAGVMSRDAMEARGFNAQVPFVDWMLYLSNDLMAQASSVPQPVAIQRVDGIGSIFIVQNELPDPKNPDHLRKIERLEAALKIGL